MVGLKNTLTMHGPRNVKLILYSCAKDAACISVLCNLRLKDSEKSLRYNTSGRAVEWQSSAHKLCISVMFFATLLARFDLGCINFGHKCIVALRLRNTHSQKLLILVHVCLVCHHFKEIYVHFKIPHALSKSCNMQLRLQQFEIHKLNSQCWTGQDLCLIVILSYRLSFYFSSYFLRVFFLFFLLK